MLHKDPSNNPKRTDAGKLKVFGLWNHGEAWGDVGVFAKRCAREANGKRVVFAQVVNGKMYDTKALRQLGGYSIDVVFVSEASAQYSDADVTLIREVQERLDDVDALMVDHKATIAPSVDNEAAVTIADAFERMPSVPEKERKKQLEEYYGAGEVDDGVR